MSGNGSSPTPPAPPSPSCRFRHCKRYYFAFDYDWERLDLVRSKYLACRNQVRADLEAYAAYVERLAAEARKA